VASFGQLGTALGHSEVSAVAGVFFATWAWPVAAISAKEKATGIILKSSRINKKEGRHSSCLPSSLHSG